MTTALTALAILVLSLLAVLLALVVVAWPLLSAVRERQRVDQEVRLAEVRMHHVAHRAMQRLLDEARRQP